MSTSGLPPHFSQNVQLPIRIVSPDFGHLSAEAAMKHGRTHRLPYYFFLFIVDGASQYQVDMDKYEVGKNELLFSLPHQILHMPASVQGNDYYKLGFDEECLSRLPKQYPFLLNPLNQQK